MVSLKENNKLANLEGGTLYASGLEKLPQAVLSQYYQWIKENGSMESLEELRHWVVEEAEYQVQASEIKHGLSSVGRVRGKSLTKSYFGTTEEKCDHPCKVCNQKHPVWGNAICSREWNIEKSGRETWTVLPLFGERAPS